MLMSRMPACWMRLWLFGVCPLASVSLAETEDPAVRQVQILDASLLKSMHAGSNETVIERYRTLEPVISDVFDLGLMTRLAVGAAWTSFSADEQRAVVAAFSRLTIAGYAHNFQQYGGEIFQVDDNVVTRGTDKIIQAHINSGHDASANLIYRARRLGDSWKIIDVNYDGISELTMRRSDFGAAIAGGGATALIAHLNRLSDEFLKR